MPACVRGPLHLVNRLPSIEEVRESVQPPLYESYWWFRGWNFNRPVMAKVNIGAHIKTGPYVRMEVGEGCPDVGYRVENMVGLNFEMIGPIELPSAFSNTEDHGPRSNATGESNP